MLVHLMEFHEIPMIFSWFPMRSPMIFLSYSYDDFLDFLRLFWNKTPRYCHDFLFYCHDVQPFLRISYYFSIISRFSMVFPWIFPQISPGFPIISRIFPRISLTISMDLSNQQRPTSSATACFTFMDKLKACRCRRGFGPSRAYNPNIISNNY